MTNTTAPFSSDKQHLANATIAIEFAITYRGCLTYGMALDSLRLALSKINRISDTQKRKSLQSQWFKAFNQLKQQSQS